MLALSSARVSCVQTTYENFRYRYDKKENPYNKGLIKNFQEVFFTRIPPSKLDFRAFVQEDEIMTAEPTDEDPIEDSSKEKIDIEMGNTFGEDNAVTLPEILLSLEFGGIQNNLKHRVESEATDQDKFLVPADQELEESDEAKANAEEKREDRKSEETTTSGRS